MPKRPAAPKENASASRPRGDGRDALDEHKRKVLAKVGIAEIVGEHVELKRAGLRLKGLCPFHQEKSPSFTVNEELGFYHCFGCGAGGDAIKFLREIEGLGFIEALTKISRLAGIAMPESRPSTPEQKKKREERRTREETLQLLHEEAAKFFRSRFERGGAATDYAKRRGLTPEAIEAWGIGAAPPEWTGLLEHAERGGFAKDLVVEAGLAVAKEETGRVYDRFRNRLIFPIRDPQGRVVAFGARAIAPEDEPKYINSPETPIYRKSETLFGFDLARAEIRKTKTALLLEGYMDVIALWQAGWRNVVASCGTALTSEQAALLHRLCDKVLFLYDGDDAGQKAMRRGCVALFEAQMNVAVVQLPKEHDPDSFVREHGAEAFKAKLETAREAFDHFLDAAIARFGVATTEGKVRVVDDMVELVESLRQPIARQSCLDRLALAVGVTTASLGELLRDRARHQRPRPSPAEALSPPAFDEPPAPPPMAPIPDVEKAIARLMIERPAWRDRIGTSALPFEWFTAAPVIGWLERLSLPDAPVGAEAVQDLCEHAHAPTEAVLLREILFWRDDDFANPAESMLTHLANSLSRDYRAMRLRRMAFRMERPTSGPVDLEPSLALDEAARERLRALLEEVHAEAVEHMRVAGEYYVHPDRHRYKAQEED
jgi:DNA primase